MKKSRRVTLAVIIVVIVVGSLPGTVPMASYLLEYSIFSNYHNQNVIGAEYDYVALIGAYQNISANPSYVNYGMYMNATTSGQTNFTLSCSLFRFSGNGGGMSTLNPLGKELIGNFSFVAKSSQVLEELSPMGILLFPGSNRTDYPLGSVAFSNSSVVPPPGLAPQKRLGYPYYYQPISSNSTYERYLMLWNLYYIKTGNKLVLDLVDLFPVITGNVSGLLAQLSPFSNMTNFTINLLSIHLASSNNSPDQNWLAFWSTSYYSNGGYALAVVLVALTVAYLINARRSTGK